MSQPQEAKFWWLDMPRWIPGKNKSVKIGDAVLCGPHFESTDCGVSLLCHGIDKPWHAYTRQGTSGHWFERFADRDKAIAAVERHYLAELKARP